jgi:hypothetical protein
MNCLSFEPNRTVKVVRFMFLNQTITNFSLKKTEPLKKIKLNQTDNHESNRTISV